jgi:hypothetical protein
MAYGDKFKEQWNKVDEVCPHCNQVTKVERGLSRQNLKRLFFSKPTLSDWIILTMLILVLLTAWAYKYDTQECRDTLNNLDNVCVQIKLSRYLEQDFNEQLTEQDFNEQLTEQDFNEQLTEQFQPINLSNLNNVIVNNEKP